MATKPTVDPLPMGEEIDFHPEGVALFSPRDNCFGQHLSEIVERVKPSITNYGDSVVMEPHDDCMTEAIDGGTLGHILLLEKSVWLVDCDCLIEESLFSEFKHLIRTFPKTGNAIIWVDDDIHALTDEEEAHIKNFSRKPDVVFSQSRLVGKLEDYIEYSANPYFGCGSIADWRNEVHQLQKTIG